MFFHCVTLPFRFTFIRTVMKPSFFRLFLLLSSIVAPPLAGQVRPVEVKKLTPLSGLSFGAAAATDGLTAAVAAPGSDAGSPKQVFLYNRDAGSGSWPFAKTVSAFLPIGYLLGNYGYDLAVDGDTLVVGAPVNSSYFDYSGRDGRVFIYRRNSGGAGNWAQTKRLDGQVGGIPRHLGFGRRVALSGANLAVLAADGSGHEVRVHKQTIGGADGWGQVARIPVSVPPGAGGLVRDGGVEDALGMSGDYLAIGVPGDGDNPDDGGVFIHHRRKNGDDMWGEIARIRPADAGARTLGHALAVSGNRLAVSGIGEDADGKLFTAVWVFTLAPEGAVIPDGVLTAAGSSSSPWPPSSIPGQVVTLAGDWMSVSAWQRTETSDGNWATLIYHRGTSGWVLHLILPGPASALRIPGLPRMPADIPPAFIRQLRTKALEGILTSKAHPALAMGGEHLILRTVSGELPVVRLIASGSPSLLPEDTLKPNAGGSTEFGQTLAADGNHLVVGDPYDSSVLPNAGAVWVYRRFTSPFSGMDDWILTAKHQSPSPQENAHFGAAVAIASAANSYSVAVGSPDAKVGGVKCGAVHTFGAFSTGESLAPAMPAANDRFGAAVAVGHLKGSDGAPYGLRLAVGAPGQSIPSVSKIGRVTTYTVFNPDTPWQEEAELLPADRPAQANFGWSLALDGSRIAVGALTAGTAGRAYIYEYSSTPPAGWSQTRRVDPGDTVSGAYPHSLALEGDTLVGGTLTLGGSGAVFIHSRNSGGSDVWGVVKKLTSPNPNDSFGATVALRSDLIAVGARGDDLLAPNHGAIRIFERNLGGANNWGQALYGVESGDGDPQRFSGASVAFANDTVLFGAPNDDDAGPDVGAVRAWRVGSYERWCARTGLVGLGGDQAEAGADPDGDGLPNLMEFVLGGDPVDPVSPAAAGVPHFSLDPVTGLPRLAFPKPFYSQEGLRITAEGSTDLLNFSESRALVEINDAYDFQATWHGDSSPRLFLRLKAVYPVW